MADFPTIRKQTKKIVASSSGNQTYASQFAELYPYFSALSEDDRLRSMLYTGSSGNRMNFLCTNFDKGIFERVSGSVSSISWAVMDLTGCTYTYAFASNDSKVTVQNISANTNSDTLYLIIFE